MRGPDRGSIAKMPHMPHQNHAGSEEQSARKTIEIWVKVEAAMEGIFIEHVQSTVVPSSRRTLNPNRKAIPLPVIHRHPRVRSDM